MKNYFLQKFQYEYQRFSTETNALSQGPTLSKTSQPTKQPKTLHPRNLIYSQRSSSLTKRNMILGLSLVTNQSPPAAKFFLFKNRGQKPTILILIQSKLEEMRTENINIMTAF